MSVTTGQLFSCLHPTTPQHPLSSPELYNKYKPELHSYITCGLSESAVMFVLSLQYDYEYDEHGERVILGKGTFGVVYAGRDLSNQVRLAIKEIPERDCRSETES